MRIWDKSDTSLMLLDNGQQVKHLRCLKVEVQYCVTSHLTRIADRVIIVMQTTVSYK